MLGIYFSGTGNSKYCVERFIHHYGKGKSVSIEDPNIIEAIQLADKIVLRYPVYYSNIPKILRDFIANTNISFHGEKVFVIATFRFFSGDGAGCSARLLKKSGADVCTFN